MLTENVAKTNFALFRSRVNKNSFLHIFLPLPMHCIAYQWNQTINLNQLIAKTCKNLQKLAKPCTPLLFPRPQDIVLSTVLDAKCTHIYMYSLCFHLCEVGRDAVVLLYLWTMWSLWSLWSLSNWRESSGRQQVGSCRASFHSLVSTHRRAPRLLTLSYC